MSDESYNEEVSGPETRSYKDAGTCAVGGRRDWAQPAESSQQSAQFRAPVPQSQPFASPTVPCVAACGNYANPTKKNTKWVVLLVIIALLCVTTMFCVSTCCSSFTSFLGSSSSEAGAYNPSVAVINIDDSIDYNGTACSPEGFKVLLDEATNDSNIVAVVLRVNSGGGVATAGEEMATYLKEFKEATGKPVVVSSASTNASAAYEISSQADYIFTAKSTAIGAIGTALQLTDYSGLLDMLGIKITDITSAESKDSTYGTRALTEDEIATYQHQIDQINESFIATVAEGRGMTVEQVLALATGLTYTGLDAVDNGLADKIGTLEDAMDKAADLAGVGPYYAYELTISSNDLSDVVGTLLGASSRSSQNSDNLIKEYADVKSVQ